MVGNWARKKEPVKCLAMASLAPDVAAQPEKWDVLNRQLKPLISEDESASRGRFLVWDHDPRRRRAQPSSAWGG